ncbi:hypothetical protein GQX74_002307, partial [Glossina fuscipes]
TGRTPGCEHCPPGTTCDPSTGACIKDKRIITANTSTSEITTRTPITTITNTTSTTSKNTTAINTTFESTIRPNVEIEDGTQISTSSTTMPHKPKTTKKEDEGRFITVTTEKAKTTRKEDDSFDLATTTTEKMSITTAAKDEDIKTTTLPSRTTTYAAGLTATSKSGPPKGYRDGENNITDTTAFEMASTQAANTSTTLATSSITPYARGEDVKGIFNVRTSTTPKMKTTRIDTSNEFDDYNITTMFTTTPRYDGITFPVIMVTDDLENESSANKSFISKSSDIEKMLTMFPVITPESTTPTDHPRTMPAIVKQTQSDLVEPIVNTATGIITNIITQTRDIASTTNKSVMDSNTMSTIKSKIIEDSSSTIFPVITEKITEISEIPGTTATMPGVVLEPMISVTTNANPLMTIDNSIYNNVNVTITTTTPTVVTVINTTCTVHTNCGLNQLCIMGQCRLKCRGDGHNEYDCVKGIFLV